MIKSMTGFGRGEYEEDGRSFSVEIKSVNNRYIDVSVRLPRHLSYLEDNVRKYITQYISRGKVDVYICQDKFNVDDITVSVDHTLANSYIKALHQLRDEFRLEDDITTSLISKLPDVLTVERVKDDQERVWEILTTAIDKAIKEFLQMRRIEGQKLENDIINRVNYIRTIVKEIEERSPVVVEEYREKLSNRITQIVGDIPVDEARLAVEVAIFADKSSITEEIVRLYSHLDQMLSILKEEEPVGRKLDFLVQEMNREINTIGSKASDIIITRHVVDVKSEIEKIREQIQNVE